MLIYVLTHDFAPNQSIKSKSNLFKVYERREQNEISSMNALEVAIEGSAKNFVSSPLVQRLLGKERSMDIILSNMLIHLPLIKTTR
jgi:hypothetical protein